ncbi:hypothetical conserved protein [Candidatus Nitrosoglobus terrae]|uniref:Hypothetical conserved protein n=1 Tax=Candidatus Nitrosoglobus terrae TaxID=1630141 RepID=A0A1Q2SKN8_9GAMM|nr:hypothetical protein [Candidatus Nitrosoglobus terrae]BAW79673.1 hypothetical conserved protein [Candidatus Nitrosoglobus terrae]
MDIDKINKKNAENIATQLIPESELRPTSVTEVINLPSFYEKILAFEKILETPFGEIAQESRDTLIMRRLQQIVNTLTLNSSWKDRIGQSGLDKAPRNFEEWQQLPLSDKTLVSNYFTGQRPGMIVPLSHGGFEIIASGGTSSGTPAETVYSLRELWDTYKIAGDFMGRYVLTDYLKGIEPKWMITSLADYQMWSSGTMVGGVLQHIPGINYIAAGPIMKEVFQHVMSYRGPKAFMGISRGIAILTDLGFDMSDEARNTFRVALYGSGVLPQRKREELKSLYPNLAIMSYFAATEAETIGVQLSPVSYLAAVPGLHFIEIVDDNGKWVDEGQEGELVVTRLHAHEAPVLRFKLGDRMIRRPNLDEPRLKTQQFEFSGRSGDIIHLGDTQYMAIRAYESLCRELNKFGIFDLEAAAHEIQFFNDRRAQRLTFIAVVDEISDLRTQIEYRLGTEGVKRLFMEALISSLSMFNRGEANVHYLEKTGYQFEIRLVNHLSPEIYRTSLGKTPLLRDTF